MNNLGEFTHAVSKRSPCGTTSEEFRWPSGELAIWKSGVGRWVAWPDAPGTVRHLVDDEGHTRIFSTPEEAATVLLEKKRCLASQLNSLRAFAQEVMSEWPDGCLIDPFDLQEAAHRHGLLEEVTVTEPCDEEACSCAECGDFPQKCYRRTALLDGEESVP